MDQEIFKLAEQLGRLLVVLNYSVVTAESCTGGGIAQAITEIAGSSTWFDRGFITYSNDAKIQMLGVKPETLRRFGAVSAETVLEMTAGALNHSCADCAVAVSGIAGPGGGTESKPVGTVYIGWLGKGQTAKSCRYEFTGDRYSIRQQAIKSALSMLIEYVNH